MSQQPLRVASIGIGRWSDVLGSAMQRSGKLVMAGCYTRDEKKRADFSAKYGSKAYATYEALLADPEIDAVLVTTPNYAHADVIEQAAAAGKHVWTEKPIAHTMEHAHRIGNAVKAAGVTFSVGHSARMLGASRMMRKLVDTGDIGQVSLVEGNYSNERGLELTPDKWRYYAANTPGGPLIQLLVHHFDTMQYVLGNIKEVQAYRKRLYSTGEVDDVAALVCEFENGALGYFGASWSAPGAYTINMYGTKANVYHELDFNHWTAADVDKHCTLFRVAHKSSVKEPVEIPTTDMFREELEDFADAVAEKRAPEIGFEQAARALAVVHAAIISSNERRPVAINELM
jgi:predicted dehydrogenase